MSAFNFIGAWLQAVWNAIFHFEIYNGITAGGILMALVVINLGIWFIHVFFRKEA